jgi:CubicO group peptidase (beta-lactamase class C family)
MVMQGFPPHPRRLVTTANWQDPPHNRWSFWHTRELLPTHRIAAARRSPRPLVDSATRPDLRALPLGPAGQGSTARTVGDVLQGSFTDAWVVLHDGELVDEWYDAAGSPDATHAAMSVTKSVVGCVAGALAEQGRLAVDDEVTAHVPELAGTAWAGATVRDVLDMRSGVAFTEDYADARADVRRLDDWIGWRPTDATDAADHPPRGLYAFLRTLRAGGAHGGAFVYRSAETDVLGWVCERAGGQRMADLISMLVWDPMGAEADADLICDGSGTAVHDGGLCATARDLARFGQLLLDGGALREEGGIRQILPATWFRTCWAVDADVRTAFRDSAAEESFPGGWYRNQFWFRPSPHGDVLLCLGIHGQLVHVGRRTRTVCVKLSSWPSAQDPRLMQQTLAACDAVSAALGGAGAGRTGRGDNGVVSGRARQSRPARRRPGGVI